MNTTTAVSLQVIGTGLVALGFQSISGSLLTGAIEILLGIGVYAVYEYFPSKTT